MKESLKDLVGSLAYNLLVAGWVTTAILSVVVLRYSWSGTEEETRTIIQRIGWTAFAIVPVIGSVSVSYFGGQILTKGRHSLGIKLLWAGVLGMVFVSFWPWSGAFMHAPGTVALLAGTAISSRRLSKPQNKRIL